MAEQHDEWAEGRRYLGVDVLARTCMTLIDPHINTVEIDSSTEEVAISA